MIDRISETFGVHPLEIDAHLPTAARSYRDRPLGVRHTEVDGAVATLQPAFSILIPAEVPGGRVSPHQLREQGSEQSTSYQETSPIRFHAEAIRLGALGVVEPGEAGAGHHASGRNRHGPHLDRRWIAQDHIATCTVGMPCD